MKNVTIIVPVYGDWLSLGDCIKSLKETVEGTSNTVLFVNDCGPEVEMIEKNIKRAIKGVKNFFYHRNPKNLGFVQNCNRAVFELDQTDNDILLLNSDTIVTEGFLDELQSVLNSDKKIGTVSPRTNNATIATIPIKHAKTKDISPEDSYAYFKKYNSKLPRYNVAPVAHGFCILIRRTLIKKYGLFDEVFGKGYGEETDFCMRIAQHGYQNVISNRAYVYHMEARSFSLEAKKKAIEVSSKIIESRYPGYARMVRNYTDSILLQESLIEKSTIPRAIYKLKHKTKRAILKHKTLARVARKAKSILTSTK